MVTHPEKQNLGILLMVGPESSLGERQSNKRWDEGGTDPGNREQGSNSDTGPGGRNYPEGRLLSTAGRASRGHIRSLGSVCHVPRLAVETQPLPPACLVGSVSPHHSSPWL